MDERFTGLRVKLMGNYLAWTELGKCRVGRFYIDEALLR